MDLIDVIDDELDEFFEQMMEPMMEPRREPVFRQRSNHMTLFDEEEFRVRFRFTKNTVNYIYSLIEDKISSPTERNHAITSMNKLLLTLRYFATGSFLNVVGDFTGVSKSSACRIVNVVSKAIAQLRQQFVRFPENVVKLKEDFYEIARFPRLIGAIDCTHVPIKSPGGDNAECFRNRKSQFSINIQTIVSADLKIMDIVARWPGATHNQTIFNNSLIKQKCLDRQFGNSLIVGDKEYENTFYLLTPLQNPVTPAEHLYNKSQIRSRNVVQRTYGVWKNRFPVLSKKITLHLSRVQAVIVACAVLHNIAIQVNEAHFEDVDRAHNAHIEIEHEAENNGNMQDVTVRNNLINDYFESLLQ